MTQADDILELLRARGVLGITALDALEAGSFRLAARIADLRADGYHITSTMEAVGSKRIARYRLVEAWAYEADRGGLVMTTATTERVVICGDALVELPRLGRVSAIVTNPPDAAEVGLPIPDYDEWLGRAVRACLAATRPAGICIFAVTDRRGHDGGLYSKAGCILRQDARLLWHKILLRRAPGSADLFRPTYTDLLAFAEQGGAGVATPDVIDGGRRLWKNGLGIDATRFAVSYARRWGPIICDPFVGAGTTLACADGLYDRAIGIDIDPTMAEASRTLALASTLWGVA